MKARSSASVVRFSPAWIASRPRCGVVQERFSTVFPAKMIAQAQTGLTVMALIGTVVIGFIAVLLEESGLSLSELSGTNPRRQSKGGAGLSIDLWAGPPGPRWRDTIQG